MGIKNYFLPALTFAQRALAAAEIFALADALIVRFFLGADLLPLLDPLLPSNRLNSPCKDSILSWMSAARLRFFDVSSIILWEWFFVIVPAQIHTCRVGQSTFPL